MDEVRRWFYVDRIEGDTAVLVEQAANVASEDLPSRDVPRALLPRGTRSGDWLKLRPGAEALVFEALQTPETGGQGQGQRRRRSPFVRDEEKKQAAVEAVRSLRKQLPNGYLPPV